MDLFPEVGPAPTPCRRRHDESWKTSAFTGFEFQGDTDLDGSGKSDFNYWMISGGVNSSRMVGDGMKIALKGDYRAVGYNFSGLPGGVDPWETCTCFDSIRFSPFSSTTDGR